MLFPNYERSAASGAPWFRTPSKTLLQDPIAIVPKDRVVKGVHGAIAYAIDLTSSHVGPRNQV